MKNIHPSMIITLILAIGLTACSKQSWYQSMQYSKTADCMKGPAAEYDDCMQQSDESYQNYESSRKALTKKPSE